MRWLPLVVLAWAFGGSGCSGDCMKSSDIQVTVMPNPDVSVAQIAKLRVILKLGDAAARSYDLVPAHPLTASGSAFILRPDDPPSQSYDLMVTVQALDLGGNVMALGSDNETVTTAGCNRMVTRLTSLPFTNPGTDGSVPHGDMGGGSSDMSTTNQAGCIGGLPDEDSDNRADSCDICAADPEPTGPSDSDGDGLPDACDPDVATFGNRLIYFEPFNTNNGHWSTGQGVTVQTDKGFLEIQVGGGTIIGTSDGSDALPLGVRMQTWVQTNTNQQPQGEVISGIILANTPDTFGQGAAGVMCSINFNPHRPDTLEIATVTNGSQGPATTANISNPFSSSGGFPFNLNARLRLTQRGGQYTCELGIQSKDGSTISTATQSVNLLTSAPTGMQYMAVVAVNQDAHFHSIVAETTVP